MDKIVTAIGYQAFNQGLSDRNITDENVGSLKKTCFIQIQGWVDAQSLGFHFKKEHHNVLTVYFDDIDVRVDLPIIHPDGTIEPRQAVPMCEGQARSIVEFVLRNKDKESFLVHCHAGVSRSGGVTEWIAEFLGIPWTEYRRRNPHTSPNKRIVRLLREAYHDIDGTPY
jgi:predicted protein tyrosine phosphatase